MNRHGISQNPTEEEVALLREYWRGDDARQQAANLRVRTSRLIDENRRLAAERDRLSQELSEARSHIAGGTNQG